VLETLFDDSRLHLTEKILRPIACGKPFILVSTRGSLEYLRSYGFQTFGDFIDESYDTIVDPMERLHAIIKVMSTISNMKETSKKKLWKNMNQVCQHNKTRFFSDSFAHDIQHELHTNVLTARNTIKQHYQQGRLWSKQTLARTPSLNRKLYHDDGLDRFEIASILKECRQRRFLTTTPSHLSSKT
jgi:hypothetical protein